MLFSSAEAPVSTPSSARNYIVYDPNSSEILEGKDYEDVYSVASISKIMTAVLALESSSLFEIVTVGDIIYSIEDRRFIWKSAIGSRSSIWFTDYFSEAATMRRC